MNAEINLLLGEIRKSSDHLDRLAEIYAQAVSTLDSNSRSLEKAVFLSEIFANYYTCLESVFFRVSQFFENSLPEAHWHRELLERMRMEIPDVREPVISEETRSLLDEFRKFRHFKRYYYSMDYDWDKIDYLRKKFQRLIKTCPEDISSFESFLIRLKKEQ